MSSGMAASTVDSRHHEQDLAGFPEEVEHSRDSAVTHVGGTNKDDGAAQTSVVQSPSKFAAREHSEPAHAIGTGIHPSTAEMHTVSSSITVASV